MARRTTIEIDEALLERAMNALGQGTMRGTVEEALRRATDKAECEEAERAANRRRYFDELPEHADLEVMASDAMWR